ncbi:MAG TPA: hypothetical protein VMI52_01965 [Acetobacteraceae bacterium]|nr:hypothetical protein [Acetobacteraceae bacterium]
MQQIARDAEAGQFAAALAEAAAAIARLDEALEGHPLRPAFLYRSRLDAVRRQAAVDGWLIDPWHLAAVLEGLRLRMEGALRIVDRGAVFAAARHALAAHRWLTAPDPAEEEDVRRAAACLDGFAAAGPPLLAAAHGVHAWLAAGGARPPVRAALIRHWTGHRLLRLPVPLTGAAALRAGLPRQAPDWTPVFLRALAEEAAEARQGLRDLERAWFAARGRVADRRRDSHAAAAVDLLAAAPLLSATSLAAALGVAVKTALHHLDALVAEEIAVEVTHRAKRRLFALAGMAPLRASVRPPPRPEPGRGRGRPPARVAADLPPETPPALPPPGPLARRSFDYGDLEHGLTQLEQTLRRTRRALDALAAGPADPDARGPAPDSAS